MKHLAPSTETARLAALQSYGILDTVSESAYDNLARLAAAVCDAPMALINFIDADRQWCKTAFGLPTPHLSREQSFCSHAILSPDPLIIPDLRVDPRFADSPFVTQEGGLRFYAGVPLSTPDGHRIGTLCVADRRPRSLTADQQTALCILSDQVMAQLELRRQMTVLEHEVAQRKQAEQVLQRQDLALAVFDTVSSLILVLDPQGSIVRWNRACAEAFGYGHVDLTGRPCWEVFGRLQEVPSMTAFFRQATPHDFPLTRDVIGLTQEGHERVITCVLTALLTPESELAFVVVTGTDITIQRQAEIELRAYATRLELLTEASRAFAETSLDYTALLERVVQHIAQKLGCLCLISLPSNDGHWLHPAAVHDVNPEALAVARVPLISSPLAVDSLHPLAQVFRSGQPVLLPAIDPEQLRMMLDPEYWPAIDHFHISSSLVAPLQAYGQVIGVVGLSRHWVNPLPFSEEDMRLLLNLADRAALAIENARLFAQLQHELAERQQAEAQLHLQARRLKILSEASRAFAEPGLPAETLLERVVSHIAEQLGCVCGLHQRAEEGSSLLPVAIADADAEARRAVQQLPAIALDSLHPLAQVFHSGQPLFVPLVDPEQLRSQLPDEYAPGLERFPVRSLLIVPVQSQGQSLGVLTLLRRYSHAAEFTADDLHLAQDLADRAALAIENGHLFARAQQELAKRERAEQALAVERAELARRVAERTEDLSLANAELARAARLKDEFLATMSHELRTPLNSILGRAQVLEEEIYGPVTPEQVRALQGIEESGHHLLALINDILDLSKIETGQVELEHNEVDVELLCAMCLRMVKEAAVVKRLCLVQTLDGLVETLLADERRLRQILVNLLSNAVKFTPEGGTVGLEVRGDAEHGTITFTVWDTGIGIAAEDLPKLFRPFVQLDSRLNRQYTGTGLGLALVLRLAKAHGGSVSVESAPGQGSRFCVSLPWSPTEPADKASVSIPVVEMALPVLRQALVIEDSASSAAQLVRYLGALGVQTEVHPGASHAVERAATLQPDLILLDILLPDGDGWQVLRLLKAEPRTSQIPVLVVSVVDEPARARDAGAVRVLLKPIKQAVLVEKLGQHFVLREPAPAQPGHMDAGQPQRRLLLAEDNEANIAAVSDYLRMKGYEVLLARNGSEAVVQAREQRPDLILMDIQMPGMDGLEATRQLRADPALADIPIIALTALAMPGDRERCLAAGASEYLTKPVHLRTLLATIEALWPTLPDERRADECVRDTSAHGSTDAVNGV